MFNYY